MNRASDPVEVEVTTETSVTFEDPELEVSLPDRFMDAVNVMRFFHRRDEMNAEVHFDPSRSDGSAPYKDDEGWHHEMDVPIAKVRYSPITMASERVAGWLARLLGAENPDMRQYLRFTDVENHGTTVRVGYLEQRLSAKDEALEAAQAMWSAARNALNPPTSTFTGSAFDIDPRKAAIVALQDAMDAFVAALTKAQTTDTQTEVADSEAKRCTYVYRDTTYYGGTLWGRAGDRCGWNAEAGVHPAENERKMPGQHVWRHEDKKRGR